MNLLFDNCMIYSPDSLATVGNHIPILVRKRPEVKENKLQWFEETSPVFMSSDQEEEWNLLPERVSSLQDMKPPRNARDQAISRLGRLL